MFSANINHLWVDNLGLHLTYAPTDGGCGGWAATETELDRSLGYGSYLVSFVGVVEHLTPDVTWSPFFIWDHTGNSQVCACAENVTVPVIVPTLLAIPYYYDRAQNHYIIYGMMNSASP